MVSVKNLAAALDDVRPSLAGSPKGDREAAKATFAADTARARLASQGRALGVALG